MTDETSNESSELVSQDISTKEIIRRYVSDGSKWHEPEPGVYHASSVWTCLRAQYYTWKKLPKTNDAPYGLLHMGKVVERELFTALQKHYGHRFVKNDVPVRYESPDGWALIGESDPVLFTWNLKPVAVFECKSSSKGEDASPYSHYKHQASIYTVLLNCDEMRIVQPARNDLLDMSETVIRGEDIIKLWSESLEYFKTLHNVLQSDVLPAAVPFRDDECGSDGMPRCPYRARCIQDGGWNLTSRELKRGPRKGLVINTWSRDSKAIDEEVSPV